MKSNVTMLSTDRMLFGVTVKQHTENSFISISDLQKAYETGRWEQGWTDRRINNVLQSHTVHERIYYLLYERGIVKTGKPAFIEMVEKEGIVKVMRGLKMWKVTGKGDNKSVYCDPYIWVLLALEMNPMIYAKVVMWLTDSLIFDRLEAGDEYQPMNSAIKTIVKNPDYPKFAKTINIKVFGKHQTGMRQLGSASQLKMVASIEKFITNSINMGFLKTENDILKAIKTYT